MKRMYFTVNDSGESSLRVHKDVYEKYVWNIFDKMEWN